VVTTLEACENGYKTCRQFAGYTQEEAAEQLHIGVRTLQAYEAKRFSPDCNSDDDLLSPVPESVVKQMITVYGVPLLAWWHIRHATLLGREFPDVYLPKSPGDMGFQTSLALEDIKRAETIVKVMFSDRRLRESRFDILKMREYRHATNQAAERLLSNVVYADTLISRSKDIAVAAV